MRLSLVFPAWCAQFGLYEAVARKASSFPPLNLCLVAALAEKAGWDVQVIDAEAERLRPRQVAERVARYRPDLIGLTATTPFFHAAADMARRLKQRLDTPIVVGGPHVSLLRSEALLDCFDYLVVGECELTLADFLAAFAAGEGAAGVAGIVARRGGEVVCGGEAPRLEDLDRAPLPARHLLRGDRYRVGTLRGPKRYTSLQMTRGCPFRCVFCAGSLHGRAVRRRSIESVVEEIDLVVRRMGFQHIYFLDDNLTLDRQYILGLCEAIDRSGLRFTFEGSTRANLWDERLARRLKGCGLIRMSFGLESADEEVLRIVRKEVPLESVMEANRLNNALGIETINSVMLGLPGETRESIERTLRLICTSREIQHATYSIATPYPGTEMLEMARAGRCGLRLLDSDFAHYQRYGEAVMEVGGIQPAELIEMQRRGLRRIYSCWWRLVPAWRRHGLVALAASAMGVVKATLKRWAGRCGRRGPDAPASRR